jgi:cell division protein FtsW
LKQYLKYLNGDPYIWIITIALMAFSLVTVYSFVPILVKIEGGTPFNYLFKHFIYVLIAFCAMYFAHRIEPKYFGQLAKFGFILAIVILLITMFFGIKVNDAGRWIRIPFIGLTFQASDFAKLALIVYLSKLMVKNNNKFDNWKDGILPLVYPILIICGLILKDNFSTSVMLFILAITLLFIGKVPIIKILGILGGGVLAVIIAIGIHLSLPALNLLPRYDTWVSRYDSKMSSSENDFDNAQANNAELAIHNGAVFGQGIGDGKLKEYLPEAYADFYYSSFVEEFGSFSALFLIIIYLVLLFRILRIALKTDNKFHSFVSIGVGVQLLSQASINMMVSTGIIPVTGQNMPFLAMGGSALIMSGLSIGLVQSFAFEMQKKNKKISDLSFQENEKP